jgi:hypothetical protein
VYDEGFPDGVTALVSSAGECAIPFKNLEELPVDAMKIKNKLETGKPNQIWHKTLNNGKENKLRE